MLEALRKYLSGSPAQQMFDESDHRLAVAALLVHAVAIDGVVAEDERTKIKSVLQAEFGLDEAETRELIAEARERDSEAVDLYTFTSVLKRELGARGRQRVVEMLWEIVYADGEVHEFEDNLVWRVAELLGVSRQDRLRLKRKVLRGSGEAAD